MTVLLGCEPPGEGSAQVRVLLVQAAGDVLLLPAWSSPDRFVAACGPGQSWIEVPVEQVAALRDQVGAAAVVVDAELG